MRRANPMNSKLREALKKDFKNLYVKEFTTDWQAQRLVRETEIDVMSLNNLLALFERQLVEERIDGARDYIKWGYGDLCETKDTDDFPDIKDDPLANSCSSCEEWEHFEQWKSQLKANKSREE